LKIISTRYCPPFNRGGNKGYRKQSFGKELSAKEVNKIAGEGYLGYNGTVSYKPLFRINFREVRSV